MLVIQMTLKNGSWNIMVGYTSNRLPVKLVFSNPCQTRDEAFFLERKLKGWSRRKKIELIQGRFQV